MYGMYVPMFIQFMRKSTDLNPFRRFVMPALALCACAFMVYAAFAGYGVTVLYYLVVYAAVMGIGWLFDRRKNENSGRLGIDNVGKMEYSAFSTKRE